MPLEILGPLVICGIGLTVLAVYFSGISKPAKLAGNAEANALFLRDYSDATVTRTIMLSDKSAAFLLLDQDKAVGLVEAMGSGFLTRLLTFNDVAEITIKSDLLAVKFNDFTHKSQSYVIENSNEAITVQNALMALKR